MEDDGVEFAIVFKEDPHSFWDGKDSVTVRYILYYLVLDMLGELYGPFRTAHLRKCSGGIFRQQGQTPRRLHENVTMSECLRDNSKTAITAYVILGVG